MKIEYTGRGFQVVEFRDYNGVGASLQQSSLAIELEDEPGTGAIWLGTHPDRMHLDRERVRELVGFLQSWLDTGYFGDAEP